MKFSYRKISYPNINQTTLLLLDAFKEDPYFNLPDQGEELNKWHQAFEEGIRFCIEFGFVYGCFLEDKLIGVSLAFDFNKASDSDEIRLKKIFTPLDQRSSLNETKLWKLINNLIIKEEKLYLYILMIGVTKEYRHQGVAKTLIKNIMFCHPQYNILTDVSNNYMYDMLLNKFSFQLQGEADNCKVMLYETDIYLKLSELLYQEEIPVLFPASYKKYLGNNTKFIETKCDLLTSQNPFLFSITMSNKKEEVIIAYLNKEDIFYIQQIINLIVCEELLFKIDDTYSIAYARIENFKDYQVKNLKETMWLNIDSHREEWECNNDIYCSIPMCYNNKTLSILDSHPKKVPSSIYAELIIDCLNFRTKNETASHFSSSIDNPLLKQVERRLLDICSIQLYEEETFGHSINKKKEIGEPFLAALILSFDKDTKCAVVHLILLSNALLPTQFLDSISRNQLYVISWSEINDPNKEFTNLYNYLENNFGLVKRGKPKNFINIYRDREEINQNLLASFLYCETYYNSSEGIGQVIDPVIIEELKKPFGVSLYNYVSAYMHTNSVLYVGENFSSVYDRIITQSFTLFYIEMILFEESAIEIMNDDVIRFLSEIDRERMFKTYNLLNDINKIINNHLKTIRFWNISMKYPSSNASMKLLRDAFKIEEEKNKMERNKDQLLSVSQLRENKNSYVESKVVTILGIFLTVLSIIEFAIDPNKNSSILYLGAALLLITALVTNKFGFKHKV